MVFKERTFHGESPEEVFPQGHADLETRVAELLTAIDGLDATGISVVAKGNMILLTGTVATPEEADLAEEASASIEGVDEVVNRISVAAVR